MAIQLLGQDGSTVAGVDATFRSQKIALYPPQALAWLAVGAVSGALTGSGATTAVFSLRNISSNLILVRRVGVGFVTTTGFTTGQQLNYGLQFARAFTASDTSGTAITLTGNNCKVRTSLATLTSVDCRISAAGALAAGTKTLDTNYLGVTGGFAPTTTTGVVVTPSQDNLFADEAGDYPIVLAQNEGINVINITAMGAAGVGTLYVNIELAEATSY